MPPLGQNYDDNYYFLSVAGIYNASNCEKLKQLESYSSEILYNLNRIEGYREETMDIQDGDKVTIKIKGKEPDSPV
jgi:hypothetical protein